MNGRYLLNLLFSPLFLITSHPKNGAASFGQKPLGQKTFVGRTDITPQLTQQLIG
jgi:hypothetical protein